MLARNQVHRRLYYSISSSAAVAFAHTSQAIDRPGRYNTMASGGGKGCMLAGSFLRAAALGLVVLASAAPVARSWSKEGHMLTCQIAQVNRIISQGNLVSAAVQAVAGSLLKRDGCCVAGPAGA